jgi:hypothetical protein
MTKSNVICDDGRGRLRGRDGEADATPTGDYVNNFGSTLAAKIREAQQGFEKYPKEYEKEVMKVFSLDNTCRNIIITYGNVPEFALVHWAANINGELNLDMPLDYTVRK